jgi:ribonuclease PH
MRASVICNTIPAGNRRQRKGRADRRTTELASTVRNALEETISTELFPKAQIDVGIQVLQADGSVLAACMNAAMLAVADAGEPLPLLICQEWPLQAHMMASTKCQASTLCDVLRSKSNNMMGTSSI